MPESASSSRSPASPPRLTINLSALTANYLYLCRQAPNVETSAVVKANAYGLGAVQCARALATAGCRTFFVAYVAEGLQLRRALGPDIQIFVLNGILSAREAQQCAAAHLVPVISSTEGLSLIAERTAITQWALQVDTGMNRLGLSLAELADARNAMTRTPPQLILSHLACA